MKKPNTKEEILNRAAELFLLKGFDSTSMSDIQEKAGIARGTLYHHFESKEKIMDEVIERESDKLVSLTTEVVKDKTKPSLIRLKVILKILNQNSNNEDFMNHLHEPQNALMHEKINQKIIDEIAPLLAEVIKDGNKEGTFNTPYPLETIEMITLYANYMFDYSFNSLSEKEQLIKMKAFYHNLKILLGANFNIEDLFSSGEIKGE